MIEYRESQPLEPVKIARVFEASGISKAVTRTCKASIVEDVLCRMAGPEYLNA